MAQSSSLKRRVDPGNGGGSLKRLKTNDGLAVCVNKGDVDSIGGKRLRSDLHHNLIMYPDKSARHYANYLSDEEKNITLRHMLDTSLKNSALVSGPALITVACEHQLKRKPRALLILDFEDHSCTWACLVRSADAEAAGQLVIGPESSSLPSVQSNLVSNP